MAARAHCASHVATVRARDVVRYPVSQDAAEQGHALAAAYRTMSTIAPQHAMTIESASRLPTVAVQAAVSHVGQCARNHR